MSQENTRGPVIETVHSLDGKTMSGLSFPNVPGVSQETLALIHRQEAWPLESMSVSDFNYAERLAVRKQILNDYAAANPNHPKLVSRRVKFSKEFLDTLKDHLDDIERMRLRKRKNRRKTTKKRKQRLMGKR